MTETKLRRSILDFVRRYPAVHVREIERQMGLSSRLASYHLEELEREGRVARVTEDGFTRFLHRRALARLSRHDVPFLCLMRRAPALRITVALLADGEQTQGALSARLGLAKASTSYHLSAMRAASLVTVRRDGRERWYALRNPKYVRRMLADFEPIPGTLDNFSSVWNDLFG